VRAREPIARKPASNVLQASPTKHCGQREIGHLARRLHDHNRAINQLDHDRTAQRRTRHTTADRHHNGPARVEPGGARAGRGLVATEGIVAQRVDNSCPGAARCGFAFETALAVRMLNRR